MKALRFYGVSFLLISALAPAFASASEFTLLERIFLAAEKPTLVRKAPVMEKIEALAKEGKEAEAKALVAQIGTGMMDDLQAIRRASMLSEALKKNGAYKLLIEAETKGIKGGEVSGKVMKLIDLVGDETSMRKTIKVIAQEGDYEAQSYLMMGADAKLNLPKVQAYVDKQAEAILKALRVELRDEVTTAAVTADSALGKLVAKTKPAEAAQADAHVKNIPQAGAPVAESQAGAHTSSAAQAQ